MAFKKIILTLCIADGLSLIGVSYSAYASDVANVVNTTSSSYIDHCSTIRYQNSA